MSGDNINEINSYARQQIDKIVEICQRIKPKVVIECITYNHEKYIRDALEGFIMQQTDFPFVAIVHEDASTDGTAEILREYAEKYPDVIFPIFEKENQYSKKDGSLTRIMHTAIKATGAKYIALCEGDDYWTDPNKLQLQVDFLDSNPDYSMCFHAVEIKNEGVKSIDETFDKIISKEYSAKEILSKWIVPTCSAVLKRTVHENRPTHKDFIVGDNVLWATALTNGKVWGMENIMAVYRRNAGSWTSTSKSKSKEREKLLRWINHYEAMKESFPKIKQKVFDDNIIYYSSISFVVNIIDNPIVSKSILKKYLLKYNIRLIIGIFSAMSRIVHAKIIK